MSSDSPKHIKTKKRSRALSEHTTTGPPLSRKQKVDLDGVAQVGHPNPSQDLERILREAPNHSSYEVWVQSNNENTKLRRNVRRLRMVPSTGPLESLRNASLLLAR